MKSRVTDMEREEWKILFYVRKLVKKYPTYDPRPLLTSLIPYKRMDRQCKKLCDAINSINPRIWTVESCAGHDLDNLKIWGQTRSRSSRDINKLKKYLDNNWELLFPEPWHKNINVFMLSTKKKGKDAYKLAELLAKKIK